MRSICHQRKMRDAAALADPRPQDTEIDYTIGTIGADEAAAFIKANEYLGTVGHPLARYCARNAAGEIAAVALFGRAHVQSAGICRPLDPKNLSDEDRAYLATVACLERGACAHWAHPHTASWFIPRALRRARADHGWQIFYGYSDPEAGEIGTIYQACGWSYIGQGPGRSAGRPRLKFHRHDWPADKWVTDRQFYRLGQTADGWEVRETAAKGKYVKFVCSPPRKCRRLFRALRYPVLPYPKR